MKKFLALSILFFLNTVANGAATAVDPDRMAHYLKRLRKTSIHLTGSSPSTQEYDALERLLAHEPDSSPSITDFFRSKIRERMRHPAHFDKMTERVMALFGLGSPGNTSLQKFWINPEQRIYSPTAAASEFSAQQIPFSSSIPLMVDRMIRFSEPWDQLLTGSKYEFIPSLVTSKDLAYYGRLKPLVGRSIEVANEHAKTITFKGEENDPRLAGLVTHWAFATRYSDNPQNQGRKRAAAFYKIFLCDPMEPIVAPDHEGQSLLDRIQSLVIPRSPTELAQNFHGQSNRNILEPACSSCHGKLDPLAQSLQGLGPMVLLPKAVGGTLNYRNKGGSLAEVTGRGIGDLARELATSPEFESCQVSHFWNWFVGSEVPLSDERGRALVQKFAHSRHQIAPLIQDILLSPEFFPSYKNTDGSNYTSAEHARPPSFDRGFKRYLSGTDFFRITKHTSTTRNLSQVQSDFFTAAGIPDAATGMALLQTPGEPYLRAISDQAREILPHFLAEHRTPDSAQIVQSVVQTFLDVRILTDLERGRLTEKLRGAVGRYEHLSGDARALAAINELFLHEYFLTY